MYRFLLSKQWIALGLLMVTAAAVMVWLGVWQLHRYQYRTDLNTRIDAAASQVRPLTEVLTAPAGVPGSVGPAPDAELNWSMVTVTGRYDPTHEILARVRTLDATMGFEVITPLVLADGTAVLVDRGWLPATSEVATDAPTIPAAPSGEVTVVGRVHAPESRASKPEPFAGGLAVRRIDPAQLTEAVPYPLYGAYITLASQTPPADPALTPIPADHENAAMNAGYVVQWWAFALLTLFGFGYVAYRHAHPAPETPPVPEDDLVAPARS